MIKPKKNLQAVHFRDIDELLKSLELLDEFNDEKLKCHFCENIVSKNNFGAVFPREETILLACSKLECLTQIEQE